MTSSMLRKAAGTLFGSLLAAAAPLSAVSAMPMANASSTLNATITYNSAALLFGVGTPPAGEDAILVEVESSVLANGFSTNPSGAITPTSETSGTASASAVSSATPPTLTELAFGDSFELSFDLDAAASPSSLATAFAALDSFLVVTNTNPNSTQALYNVEFTLTYDVTTTANETVDNASNQYAFSEANITIISSENPASPFVDLMFSSDTETGILTDGTAAALTAPFSFQLFSGETRNVSVFADGIAEASSVPAPASILALAFGLLLMRRKAI